jgi:hypothetical protein
MVSDAELSDTVLGSGRYRMQGLSCSGRVKCLLRRNLICVWKEVKR